MRLSDDYIKRAYATALFELADQSGIIDTVKEDFDSWTEICSAEKEFEKLVISPYFSSEYKQQLVRRILTGRIDDLSMNFLIVVIGHNRARFLSHIIGEYKQLWEAHAGYYPVVVTVAAKISDDETAKIAADIASVINKKIKLELAVNPEIIGGVIIRYDAKVIDNTVRTRLNNAVRTILSRAKRRKINEV